MLLTAGLLGGRAVVLAQADASPSFPPSAPIWISFPVGVREANPLPQATGGDGTLTYTLNPTPALPAGLTFDAATPQVRGTAQAVQGETTYQLIATDADGDQATQDFTLTVVARPSFGTVARPTLTFTVGTAQTAAALPPATGGQDPLRYALDAATPLPRGLTFDVTTRTVAADATAVAQAAATYRLVVTDAAGNTDTLEFTIAIGNDYDGDDDGLIAIATLAQLDAVRHDLDGDGAATAAAYATAFPLPAAGMGCPAHGCRGYELTADLDFDRNDDGQITAADAAYWNGGAGWAPIGQGADRAADRPFTATLRGNGHAIARLFIHRSAREAVGLFYRLDPAAVVDGLALPNVQVWGHRHVGGVAGLNYGAILDSTVSGTVTASEDRAGGLAGANYGVIMASTASATVIGTASVGGVAGLNSHPGDIVTSAARGAVTASGASGGGLVGANHAGTITASYATGAVTSSAARVGGLVGVNEADGAITLSYATGRVTGSGNDVGGLVGANQAGSLIIGSYATGTVSGRGDTGVGGLVGTNDGAITLSHATGAVLVSGNRIGGLVGANGTAGRIAGSYATGAVTASSSTAVGGLAGQNQGGAITASYARGAVSGRTQVGGLVGNDQGGTITASYARGAVSGRTQVGGLIGHAAHSAITASYWDVTASGQAASGGGAGHTTQELQTPTAYAGLYAAWNVDVDGHPGADDPWAFGTNSQYPVLQSDCQCQADQR